MTYSYNPYDMTTGIVLHDLPSSRSESPAVGTDYFPDNTLHRDLIGLVNFEPFPQFESRHATPALPFTKENCERLFVGQIPYGTPARQVEWMVFIATGRHVYFTETIQRWTGSRTPKGCAHTYCRPEDCEFILSVLHRRVLVDDTGIWIAADDEQHAALEEYCAHMKSDKTLRFRERPYQPMVAQKATSDFVPRRTSPQPEPTLLPPLYNDFVQSAMFLPPY